MSHVGQEGTGVVLESGEIVLETDHRHPEIDAVQPFQPTTIAEDHLGRGQLDASDHFGAWSTNR